MGMLGIDVASVNDSATVSAALKDPNVKFAIMKATEGLHWNDPEFFTYLGWAFARGKLAGAYHYWWESEDPIQQAEHFLTQIGFYQGKAKGLLLALDAERMNEIKAGTVSWSQVVADAIIWLDYVKAKTKASPVLYVNKWWQSQLKANATPAQWARLSSYPLWDAEYTRTPGVYTKTSWSVVTMEQYTDAASGPGWSRLDGDWLNGDARVWAALAVPGATSSSTLWKALAALAAAGIAVGAYTSGGTVHPPVPVASPKPSVTSAVPAPTVTPKPSPTPTPSGSQVPPYGGQVTPKPPTPPHVHTHRPGPSGGRFYVVRRGDTLWGIANRFHSSVRALAALNRIHDPALIYPGQRLRVTGSVKRANRHVVHTVRAGETLSGIAGRFGTSWQYLAAVNHLKHPNVIWPGERIVVR